MRLVVHLGQVLQSYIACSIAGPDPCYCIQSTGPCSIDQPTPRMSNVRRRRMRSIFESYEMSLPNEIWAAVLGALLGAWITYRFAIKLADRNFEHLREISKLEAWRSSARDLVDAFSPELSILRSKEETVGDAMDLLREAYRDRHSKAVTVFAHYLTPERREAFQQDWLRHCYGSTSTGEPNAPDNEDDLCMSHDDLLYLHFSSEWHEKDGLGSRVRAIQSIEKLLSHAKDP